MKTTFRDVYTEKYELYAGRLNELTNEVERNDTYTIILKLPNDSKTHFIEDYSDAVDRIQMHIERYEHLVAIQESVEDYLNDEEINS